MVRPVTWAVAFVRDEEAAGSNPVTPTQLRGHLRSLVSGLLHGASTQVSNYPAGGAWAGGNSRSMAATPSTITGRICWR
jgi:hypothetical protein